MQLSEKKKKKRCKKCICIVEHCSRSVPKDGVDYIRCVLYIHVRLSVYNGNFKHLWFSDMQAKDRGTFLMTVLQALSTLRRDLPTGQEFTLITTISKLSEVCDRVQIGREIIARTQGLTFLKYQPQRNGGKSYNIPNASSKHCSNRIQLYLTNYYVR